MVKAAADERGWRHGSHRDLYAVVRRLVSETGDEGIADAFSIAGALHQNFYEGWLPRETVERNLATVAELVGKLDALEA